jgi:hypothetical protein
MITLGSDPAPDGNYLAVSGLPQGPVTGWFAGPYKETAVRIGQAWIEAAHLHHAVIEWPMSYRSNTKQGGQAIGKAILDCRSCATTLRDILAKLGVKVYCVPSTIIRLQVACFWPTKKACRGWKADAWIKDYMTKPPPWGLGLDCSAGGMLSNDHQRDAYIASLFPDHPDNAKYLKRPDFTNARDF